MEMLKKLVPRKLGNPKLAIGVADVLWMGDVYGLAGGIKRDEDKDRATVDFLLTGTFEGVPADAGNPALRSTVCQLPDTPHRDILALVAGLGDSGNVVAFGYRVGTRKAENSAGYEYVSEPIFKPRTIDPLATVRQYDDKRPARKVKAAAKRKRK